MSYYDDDEETYDDDESAYDVDDEDDDDDESVGSSYRGSGTNPFAGRSSGLPGRDRAGTPGSSPGGASGSSPFGSRTPGTGTPGISSGSGSPSGSSFGSRTPGASSGSSGSSPFGSRTPGTGTPGISSGSGSPSGSSFGSRPSGPSSPGGPSGGGSSSGSSPFNRPGSGSSAFGSGGSGSREGDTRRTGSFPGVGSSGGGSSSGSSGGDLRSALGGGSSQQRSPGSPFSSSSGGSGSSPSAGGFGSRSGSGPGGGSGPRDEGKKDDSKSRPPEKSSGGGGLTSRLGFGGKKEDAKKDDKKSGDSGRQGGGFNPFKRGGDASAQRAPASGGARSPIGGRSPSGEASKKDSGPKNAAAGAAGGLLGGLTSRLRPGQKAEEKKPDTRSGGASGGSGFSASSASGSSSAASPFGSARPGIGGRTDTGKPGAQSAPAGKDDKSGRSPFGRLRGGAAEAAPTKGGGKGQAAAAASGGLFGRVLGRSAPAQPARQRPTRAPQVESKGISLDTKLDIIGVSLVFSSLILFFSAISAEQAAISGLHRFLGQLFGWGALGVPVAMFAAGMWLIVRHFGENAPRLDPVVVAGLVVGYICLLTLFQYIEAFNYTAADVSSLAALEFRLNLSYDVYRAGGGLIGAQIYYILLTTVTEIGGFFLLIFGFIVTLIMVTDLSVAGILRVVIGVWLSFNTAMTRRAEKRRAEALLKAQSEPAAPISVSKPPAPELAGMAAASLPAPEAEAIPIGQRDILIRRGGQEIVTAGAETTGLPAHQQPAAAAAGGSGGLLGRFRRGGTEEKPLPPPKPASPMPERDSGGAKVGGMVAAGIAGGLMGRLRRDGTSTPEEKPADAAATAPAASAAFPAPKSSVPAESSRPTPLTPAAPPLSPIPTAEPGAPRLGDLLGQKAPAPAASAAVETPAVNPLKPYTPPAAGSSPISSGFSPGGSGLSPLTPRPAESSPAARSPFSPLTPAAAAPKPETSSAPSNDLPDDEDESIFSRRGTPNGEERPTPFSRISPFAPKPQSAEAEKPKEVAAEESASPLSARLDRLNAIRQGQTQPSAAPAASSPLRPAASILPVDDEDEDEEDEEVFAGKAESPAPSRPAPTPFSAIRINERPEDVLTPARPASTSAEPRPVSPVPPPGAPVIPTTPAAVASPISLPQKETNGDIAQLPVSTPPTNQTRRRAEWRLPDYRTLLTSGSEQEFDRERLLKLARVIEDTLQSFGAPGRVVEVNTGPVITQFGVEPDYLTARGGKKARVKVGAIAALDKDLQLALGAKSIRIEAPVPGKGYVGIEVPNEKPSLVSLRDVMESDRFRRIKSPLAIALGQSVDGSPIAADLTAMPHLLVAGTTGSGKSVLVNAIISSLIVQNPPDRVKFIMVDPKRVELTGYNGIPHLVAPVVVDLERIVGVLKWCTREMDERYKKFSSAGARNIEDYNKHLDPGQDSMPYLVVIIDELADLMMLAPEETERVITRIAALARATGIHLVIATQRPSVDVVTGLIKANFPARIAFAVAGGVDSRVILDQPGAERLLGRGDMLYLSPDSPAPLRLQGVFVSDVEINNITRYWKRQSVEQPDLLANATITPESATLTSTLIPSQPAHAVLPRGERVRQQAFWDNLSDPTTPLDRDEDDELGDDEQEDELYEKSVALVRQLGKASVSLLQRRLRIGYTRAARLIDLMEERGVVGPATEGSKPREVLPAR